MSYFVWGPHGYVEVDYRIQDDLLPVHPWILKKGKPWRHPDPQWWYDLSKLARERDCFRCVACNSGKRLNVHHRTYDRFGHELLEDIYTLCRGCHVTFHRERRVA